MRGDRHAKKQQPQRRLWGFFFEKKTFNKMYSFIHEDHSFLIILIEFIPYLLFLLICKIDSLLLLFYRIPKPLTTQGNRPLGISRRFH